MEDLGQFLQDLPLAFLPLFVAMDAAGNLPFLLSLTESMTARERTKTVRIAILTAAGLGLGFLAVGKVILVVLSIEVADFLVAGGIILMALSIKDLLTGKMMDSPTNQGSVAVVPIGTPLLVGPAVLTTMLLLVDQLQSEDHTLFYAIGVLLVAFSVNLVVAWVIFGQGNRIAGWLGEQRLTVMSKVASLLLAAIAIKMVRLGITEIWGI